MVQDHKATAQTLGKVIKLFGRENILKFKKTSAEENLRFRRDQTQVLHPCVKEVNVLMINPTHGVKIYVCYNTTNLGCNPVNGKYLCVKDLSMYQDSAGKPHAYISGCKCVNPSLKSKCKLKILFNSI